MPMLVVYPTFPDSYPPPLPTLPPEIEAIVFTDETFFPAPPNRRFVVPGQKHNQVFEFRGDAEVYAFCARWLCEIFAELREGPLTDIRSQLVCNELLSWYSLGYSLPSRLRPRAPLASLLQTSANPKSSKKNADLMEAFIGGLCAAGMQKEMEDWLKPLMRPWADALRLRVLAIRKGGGKRNEVVWGDVCTRIPPDMVFNRTRTGPIRYVFRAQAQSISSSSASAPTSTTFRFNFSGSGSGSASTFTSTSTSAAVASAAGPIIIPSSWPDARAANRPRRLIDHIVISDSEPELEEPAPDYVSSPSSNSDLDISSDRAGDPSDSDSDDAPVLVSRAPASLKKQQQKRRRTLLTSDDEAEGYLTPRRAGQRLVPCSSRRIVRPRRTIVSLGGESEDEDDERAVERGLEAPMRAAEDEDEGKLIVEGEEGEGGDDGWGGGWEREREEQKPFVVVGNRARDVIELSDSSDDEA